MGNGIVNEDVHWNLSQIVEHARQSRSEVSKTKRAVPPSQGRVPLCTSPFFAKSEEQLNLAWACNQRGALHWPQTVIFPGKVILDTAV